MSIRQMKGTALACLLLPAAACAQSAPPSASAITLSGVLDLGLRQVRNAGLGTDRSVVHGASSTSRLVIRGQEDLGSGRSASFFLDSTIVADTGGAGASAPSGQFWDRRATVSLTDRSLGELRLGRDWVPTQLVWSGFDPFSTLGVASANTFRSTAASRVLGQAFGTAPETQAANPTLRVSNAVEYFLPSGLGGLHGGLIATAGERGTTAAGQTSGRGLRLGWSAGRFMVSAAQFTTRNTRSGQDFVDRSLGASWNFGDAKLSLAQRRWRHGDDRQVNTLLGLTVAAGAGQIRLSWVHADQSGTSAATNGSDATLLGAGYVHPLSKRTTLYGQVARVSNQGGASFAIPGGPAVSASPTAANHFGGRRSTAWEIGLRHDF